MKLAVVIAVGLLGCASGPRVTETRMVQSPPLPAGCKLELVTVDITAMSFNQTWEVLGYVSLLDSTAQDAAAEGNRALVRPRACAMGGTAIAVAMNSASQGGSGLVYMVLHPKPTAPSGTSTF